MRRAYADLSGSDGPWQIHYRESGSGPALVMLHPSPLSSAFLAPQMELLGEWMRCIAWDTPGYGYSDPLPPCFNRDRSLTPYVESLLQFLDSLDLDRSFIYGSATGAQIAIAFAGTFPRRCSGLLLENVGLFEDDEADALLDGYFPDLSTRDDGEHLRELWKMAAQGSRYFPWYDTRPEALRNDINPPASVLNAVVRDHLLAGKEYDRAYRAAFSHERLEPLMRLAVPARIVQWQDGLLGKYGERPASAPLPSNVVVRRAGPGMEARMECLGQAAHELMAG